MDTNPLSKKVFGGINESFSHGKTLFKTEVSILNVVKKTL